MSVTHAIAHRLQHDRENGAILTLGQGELAVDTDCQRLFATLKGAFLGRISREHGTFSNEGEPSAVARELGAMLDQARPFAGVTWHVMEQFNHLVQESAAVVDGHCLFFVEEAPGSHLFYLFVVGRKESFTISPELQLAVSYTVDTGQALFGLKLDLKEWRERKNYAYISLLAPRGNQPLAEAFSRLTGFTARFDKADATLAFLEGVEAFARQIPEKQLPDFRSQVVDYCLEQERQDATVDVRALSRSLEGIDRDEFVRVVSSHNPDGKHQTLMDQRSLRRYVKFAGREKDLAISFSSFQLNRRVHYDVDTDMLSISGIPRQLREQLLRHLDED